MDRQRQVAYFSYSLRQLPGAYGKLDTNRLTLAHFCVQALALLGVWEDASLQEAHRLDRAAIIAWIYSLQVPLHGGRNASHAGFTGGRFLGGAFATTDDRPASAKDDDDNNSKRELPAAAFHHGHVAMTYTALCTLRTLGDDLSRVNAAAVVAALPHLQRTTSDGSFHCIAAGSEHDLRFMYCACCICHMLGDWSGMDVEQTVACIRACRNPCDGAFGLVPGQEGHGGSTFCAVASLVLLDRLGDVLDAAAKAALMQWCVGKQAEGGGLQGRPNKAEDTCYSYWIGGTLVLLGYPDLMDHARLSRFVLKCQSKLGGFSKVKGAYPDVLHAYYSLAYLSLSQDYREEITEAERLKPVNCTLGIAQDTAAYFAPLFP